MGELHLLVKTDKSNFPFKPLLFSVGMAPGEDATEALLAKWLFAVRFVLSLDFLCCKFWIIPLRSLSHSSS